MISNIPIPLLLDSALLQEGVRHYISVDFSCTPHCLISGETGSGKTYLLMLLMGKVAKYFPHAQIFILDFKDEFRFIKQISNARYFTFLQCVDGLQKVNAIFESRLQGSTDRTPIFIFFDEHSSFISYLSVRDKKLSENVKMILGNISFMGRSLGFHLTLSMQRCDASFFSSGVRDQFGLRIGLGGLSPEAKRIMFGEYDTEAITPCGTGSGWMADSRGLKAVRVPTITRMRTLQRTIAEALSK